MMPAYPVPPPPPQPQFTPSSTMPNYWNVLQSGMYAAPPIAPMAPAAPPARMVHIAPKPDLSGFPAGGAMHAPFHAHAHHHHTAAAAAAAGLPSGDAVAMMAMASAPPAPPRVVSCRCTGGCRNGRCACVKDGGMCGAACRCTSCKNPFLMVKAAGADIDALLQDSCFMHNVSKTKDMVLRLQERVDVPPCGCATPPVASVALVDCVQGYTCRQCAKTFDFSWCATKLLDHDKTPRNHCDICKRCCDHRDVHCGDCGRCYFAGVAASLPCPCKENRKRRNHHIGGGDATNTNNNIIGAAPDQKGSTSADGTSATGDESGDDKEGECTIM